MIQIFSSLLLYLSHSPVAFNVQKKKIRTCVLHYTAIIIGPKTNILTQYKTIKSSNTRNISAKTKENVDLFRLV